MNGAQSVFQSSCEEPHDHAAESAGGGCGTGDTTQRDIVLAKIAEKRVSAVAHSW